jgi:hypothetical protein
MLDLGLIQPSKSPAGYPVLFVHKKNTEDMCFCINYRHLNSIIIKNRYALLLITDLRDKLNRAYWFTTIDLRSAYYLV